MPKPIQVVVAAYPGTERTIVTTKATHQIETGPGYLARVVVVDAGTAWTLAVYDDDDGTSDQIWAYATADGTGTFEIGLPVDVGIRVVSGGTTAGRCVIAWG